MQGGEYETLCLDCPLFSKRLVIDTSRIHVTTECDMSPVAHLQIESWHLEAKEPHEVAVHELEEHPALPPVRDPKGVVESSTPASSTVRVCGLDEGGSVGWFSVSGLTPIVTELNGEGCKYLESHRGTLDEESVRASTPEQQIAIVTRYSLTIRSLFTGGDVDVELYSEQPWDSIKGYRILPTLRCKHRRLRLGQYPPTTRSLSTWTRSLFAHCWSLLGHRSTESIADILG